MINFTRCFSFKIVGLLRSQRNRDAICRNWCLKTNGLRRYTFLQKILSLFLQGVYRGADIENELFSSGSTERMHFWTKNIEWISYFCILCFFSKKMHFEMINFTRCFSFKMIGFGGNERNGGVFCCIWGFKISSSRMSLILYQFNFAVFNCFYRGLGSKNTFLSDLSSSKQSKFIDFLHTQSKYL